MISDLAYILGHFDTSTSPFLYTIIIYFSYFDGSLKQFNMRRSKQAPILQMKGSGTMVHTFMICS